MIRGDKLFMNDVFVYECMHKFSLFERDDRTACDIIFTTVMVNDIAEHYEKSVLWHMVKNR